MAGTAKEVDQGIEFSVYTFEKTKSAADQGKWQMQGTQTQMADALKAAEQLFDTGQYSKVEVKQKYFDKKQNRNIDTTLKVFQEIKQKSEVNVFVIFLFAVACGAAAFTATLYLSHSF
ncbi:MAG TPA: hypothetical protein EYG18_02305 [Micavibrio sp.]|nr:hypothetical protein [Micavibrio sp.]HIL28080.1 hypothetical protein [Micavibrio sp.]